MNKDIIQINDREVICLMNDKPKYLLLNLIDEREKDDQEIIYNEISKNIDDGLLLVSLIIKDWNLQLSPWKSQAVFGNDDFKGEAASTLKFILDNLLTEIRNKYLLNKDIKIVLGGYSLAGLFSLWSAYQTNVFSAVAGVSPSVWFPGFIDYVKINKVKTRNIYLSLGDKEEKTKNKVMSLVGNGIRELDNMYISDTSVDKNILEWNKGNHFVDVNMRMVKGFTWCINSLSK